MSSNLVILGAGSFARELFWFARDANPEVQIAFADDLSGEEQLHLADESIPVVADWRFGSVRGTSFRRFLVGVADPAAKRTLVEKARAAGLEPAPTLVDPHSRVRPDCRTGVGGAVAGYALLTSRVTLGDFALVLDSSVGDASVIGEYSTCLPGCRVSGRVELGDDVMLGAGTVIREGIRVARGVHTGAMACVVRDVDEPSSTLVGVPARPIRPSATRH